MKEKTLTDTDLGTIMTALEHGSSLYAQRRRFGIGEVRIKKLLDGWDHQRYASWVEAQNAPPTRPEKTKKKGRQHLSAGFVSPAEPTGSRWPLWRHLAKETNAFSQQGFAPEELVTLQTTAARLFRPGAFQRMAQAHAE